MKPVLEATNLNIGTRSQGKVRDVYRTDDRVILVATDRHSVFDRVVAHVPGKGQVLNRLSAYWFAATNDIVANHVLAVPDPNVTVARACTPIAIEAVMRGYLTGSTATSIWRHYKDGRRDFGTFQLPDGMRKNEKFSRPIFTPSTKDSAHDKTISTTEAIGLGLVNADLMENIESISRKLFARGQEECIAKGIILADTKYEFGIDADGKLRLIDEIHTSDSSRYWEASSYEERLEMNMEPDAFDKESLRLWYVEHCDPYAAAELPSPPQELIDEISARYGNLFQRLTGETVEAVPNGLSIEDRIQKNLRRYIQRE